MAMLQNWTEDHSSPVIEADINGFTARLTYWCTWTDLWIGLPEIYSYYPGTLEKLKNLRLTNYVIDNDEGGERAKISLIYKNPNLGWSVSVTSSPSEVVPGATVYTMDDGALEKPIESHPSYKAIWNHHLANKVGTTQTAPLLTSTAPIVSVTSGNVEWAWVKDLTEKGKDWTIHNDNKMTKPGIDSYLISAPVVRQRTYNFDQNSANSIASTVGTVVQPGNTFGKTGDWLVVSASVYFESPFWVADLAYQSGLADTELYS